MPAGAVRGIEVGDAGRAERCPVDELDSLPGASLDVTVEIYNHTRDVMNDREPRRDVQAGRRGVVDGAGFASLSGSGNTNTFVKEGPVVPALRRVVRVVVDLGDALGQRQRQDDSRSRGPPRAAASFRIERRVAG